MSRPATERDVAFYGCLIAAMVTADHLLPSIGFMVMALVHLFDKPRPDEGKTEGGK